MFIRKLIMGALALVILGAAQIQGQDPKQSIAKGVFWTDQGSGVQVFLTPKSGQSYMLTVISPKDVTVTYRTSINSVEPVVKELAPVAQTPGVKYFEFDHYFSKMTIWMSLDFTVDGKEVPALRRAFYDNIFEIAPGNMYFGPKDEAGSITVSGCVREGVECLTLQPFDGKEVYSIVAGSKLEVGAAYRITGTIAQVTICMQGKALKPVTITKLDRPCSQ